jgi:predicted solute-binding protein
MARTRIGTVQYLNAAPLTMALDTLRFDVVADHPSEIARALAAGEVDVALVPVAALLADGVDARVVPGVCIGAEGPVDSVLLVGKRPASGWKRVLLDGVSRTSAALTRVLAAGPLADRLGGAELVDVEPGHALALAGPEDGALVIGDAARHLPDELVERIDLAAAWHQATGLPFVFAVWAGRPDLAPEVQASLRAAAVTGRAAVPERFQGDDLVYLTERLRYDLDDRAMMGLRRFAALGRRIGLFSTADVRLYGPAAALAPREEGVDAALSAASQGAGAAGGTLALVAGAPLTDLLAAAARVGGGRVGVDVALDAERPRWVVEPGVGVVGALCELADAHADLVEIAPGADGVGFLRAVALARLALPNARVMVAWDDQGADRAVSALHAGADALRVDTPTDAAERADRLGAVYRALHEAALDPRGLPELPRRAWSRRGATAT